MYVHTYVHVPVGVHNFISTFWFIELLPPCLPAVLLENFSIFYNEDDTELSHGVVKDFKQNWYFFDRDSSGSIPARRIKLFLRMLRIQRLFTYMIDDNGVKVPTSAYVCLYYGHVELLKVEREHAMLNLDLPYYVCIHITFNQLCTMYIYIHAFAYLVLELNALPILCMLCAFGHIIV